MAGRKVQQDNHADQCCEITPDRREPHRVKNICRDHRRDDHRAKEPDTFVARQQRCEASCGCVKRKHNFFIIVRQTIADVRSNNVGANWVCRNRMCEKDRSYAPGDKRKEKTFTMRRFPLHQPDRQWRVDWPQYVGKPQITDSQTLLRRRTFRQNKP